MNSKLYYSLADGFGFYWVDQSGSRYVGGFKTGEEAVAHPSWIYTERMNAILTPRVPADRSDDINF